MRNFYKIQLNDLKDKDKRNYCLRNIFKLLALSLANEEHINPCVAMSYWDSITSYFSDRNIGDLGLKVENIVNLIGIEEITLDKYMMGNFCGVFGNDFTPYRAVMFLQSMIYWVIFSYRHNLTKEPVHDLYQLIPLAIAAYKLSDPSGASLFIHTESKQVLIALVNLLDTLKQGGKVEEAKTLRQWAIPNMKDL